MSAEERVQAEDSQHFTAARAPGFDRETLRRDPTVRDLARQWRSLSGGTNRGQDEGRRTLVACSGGGDSSGCLIGLWSALATPRQSLVVAHVLHDLRSPVEARADRDAAAKLAGMLGLDFVEAEVRVRDAGRGNTEAIARTLRYAALAKLALSSGCHYVATGHHAQDQLESMLMALVRGAGLRGLAGMAGARRLGSGLLLIRPALHVDREDLQRLCILAGWRWSEDATNADQTRVRAAMRLGVVPRLEAIRPGAARRASMAASLLHQAMGVIIEASAELGPGPEWSRSLLRRARPALASEVIGRAARMAGARADRVRARQILGAVRLIADSAAGHRTVRLDRAEVVITPSVVTVRRLNEADAIRSEPTGSTLGDAT